MLRIMLLFESILRKSLQLFGQIATVWTKYNIDFSQFENFIPSEWEQYKNSNEITTHYFINDWNGNGWTKLEIKEGESIVLYENDKGTMHEFILVNNELIDNSSFLNESFQNELNEIKNEVLNNNENLQNEINLLKEELELLKDQTKNLTEILLELKSKSITNIKGVDDEISVTVTDNTAKIGFAENAQFIAG